MVKKTLPHVSPTPSGCVAMFIVQYYVSSCFNYIIMELEGQLDNWESDEYVDESEDNLEVDNDEVDEVMDQAVLESDTEET